MSKKNKAADSIESTDVENVQAQDSSIIYTGANISEIIGVSGAHHIEVVGDLIILHCNSTSFQLRVGDVVKKNDDGSISITTSYMVNIK